MISKPKEKLIESLDKYCCAKDKWLKACSFHLYKAQIGKISK